MSQTFTEQVALLTFTYESLEAKYLEVDAENERLRSLLNSSKAASADQSASSKGAVSSLLKVVECGSLIPSEGDNGIGDGDVPEFEETFKFDTAVDGYINGGGSRRRPSPLKMDGSIASLASGEVTEGTPRIQSQSTAFSVDSSGSDPIPVVVHKRTYISNHVEDDEGGKISIESLEREDSDQSTDRRGNHPWIGRWARLVGQMQTTTDIAWMRPCWMACKDDMVEFSSVFRRSQQAILNDAVYDAYVAEMGNPRGTRSNPSIIFQGGVRRRVDRLSVSSAVMESLSTFAPKSYFDLFFFLRPLHPLSMTYKAWCLASMFLIGYDAFVISLEVFDLQDSTILICMEWIARIFWSLDIFLSFRIGFYVDNTYVSDSKAMAKRYLTTWFVVDLISIIPDWFLLIFFGDSGFGEFTQKIKWTKILKCGKLIRLIKIKRLVRDIAETFNSIHVQMLFKMLAHVLMIFVWVHLCACAWYFIGKRSNPSWITMNRLDNVVLPHSYFLSAQWVVSQLQGTNDLLLTTLAGERCLHMMVTILSIIALAIFISRVTNVMLSLETISREKARHLEALQDYTHRHKISSELAVFVRKCAEQNLKFTDQFRIDEEEVLKGLPRHLRRALLVEVHGSRVRVNNHFFIAMKAVIPQVFQRVCCDLIGTVFFEPDDFVHIFGEKAEKVLFLVAGDVNYDHYDSRYRGVCDWLAAGTRRPSTTGSDIPLLESTLEASRTRDNLERGRSNTELTSSAASYRTTSYNMSKEIQRENMRALRSMIETKKISTNHTLCEASLWTKWLCKGDVLSHSQSSFLMIETTKFLSVVVLDVSLQRFGLRHAERFCEVLNSTWLQKTDLIDSEVVLHMWDDKRGSNMQSSTSYQTSVPCSDYCTASVSSWPGHGRTEPEPASDINNAQRAS